MSTPRSGRTTNQDRDSTKYGDSVQNITARRIKRNKVNMALTSTPGNSTTMDDGSLFIDSILSQNELEDVHRMLEQEGLSNNRSQFTSTQMGQAKLKKPSLTLSPIGKGGGRTAHNGKSIKLSNQFEKFSDQANILDHLNSVGPVFSRSHRGVNSKIGNKDGSPGYSDNAVKSGGLDDRVVMRARGREMQGSGMTEAFDPVREDGIGTATTEVTEGRALDAQVGEGERGRGAGGGVRAEGRVVQGSGHAQMQGTGDTSGKVNIADPVMEGRTELAKVGGNEEVDEEDEDEVKDKEGGMEEDDDKGNDDGDDDDDDEDKAQKEEREEVRVKDEVVRSRFEMVDLLISQLGGKSDKLANTVKELQVSLEYSQHEIDSLKGENKQLKQKIEEMETEERRTVYQIKKVEDKIDRVDTTNKKRNLVFEDIPEADGGREDVDKVVWNILDQMNLNKGIELDSSYRVGAYNPNKTRPIVVTFVRHADRDLVFSKRSELRKTKGQKQVWVNEDLGQASRKKRNMIRLIAKQAQAEGVEHRTGKYAIIIDNKRYDENNLEELPLPLHPSSIKQIQIDKDTIAYQSENAPFSNFYPTAIEFEKCKFVCLEQAYQYVKARTLNRPLAATRIYLSRDPVEMKRIGDELGTSKLWETRRLDVMYVCLKRKFEQNEELRGILLKTGSCELVEATPERFWGCGATLSSNLLRRHEWPGENRQGKILMTVREELRREFAVDKKEVQGKN